MSSCRLELPGKARFATLSADGKRLQRHELVRGTKRDAGRRLRASLVEIESEALVEDRRMTFGALLDRWLEATKRRSALEPGRTTRAACVITSARR